MDVKMSEMQDMINYSLIKVEDKVGNIMIFWN